jgi:transmembrane sensor
MSRQDHITTQASEWYIQLTSGEATESDYHAWKSWITARPEHEYAWEAIKSATQPFLNIDKSLKLAALDTVYKKRGPSDISSISRRNVLKHLCVVFAVGATGTLAYRLKPWQDVLADYSTAVGERREVILQDGSKLFLNTGSLIAIDFTQTHRTMTLYQGEVLIETGHERLEHHRPFRVIRQ